MKIGMVSEFYYPKQGGISEHIRSLSRELACRGHEVVVVTGRRNGAIQEAGPRVETLGRSIDVPYNGSLSSVTLGPGLRSAMRALLQRERFDIVHVHNPLMPTLPLLALSAAEAPVVATLHSSYPRDFWVDLFQGRLGRLWSKIGVAIPVSTAAHRSVAGLFQAAYRIVPNGVDFADIQAACRRTRFARERRPRILFAGASVPRKGLSVLAQAFTRLRGRGVDADLLVAGDGPGTARAAGMIPPALRGDVHFLGSVPRSRLLECYAACDIFCAPSLGRESFGMVLLEAMAAGVPVVASDIDGYRDVVIHGVEGILTTPGDPNALSQALESLLLDPGARRAFGECGRRRAAGFAWPVIGRQIEEIYSEVVGCSLPEIITTAPGRWEETPARL